MGVKDIINDLHDEFKYGEAIGLVNEVIFKSLSGPGTATRGPKNKKVKRR